LLQTGHFQFTQNQAFTVAAETIIQKKKMTNDAFPGKRLSNNGAMTINKKQKTEVIGIARL